MFLPASAFAFEVSRRSVPEGPAGHTLNMGGAGTQSMAVCFRRSLSSATVSAWRALTRRISSRRFRE